MSAASIDTEIEDIVSKYEGLIARREALVQGKLKVEAEQAARKRALKKVMDETREAGLDPDKIYEEVQRAKEVVLIKLDNLGAEIEEGETLLKPMLKELREVG